MRSVVAGVTESARLYGDTHVLWCAEPDDLRSASPGSFVMAYVGDGHDPLLGRPLSIHRRRQGPGATWPSRLASGPRRAARQRCPRR